MEGYDALAKVMKALAHPARLKILRVLQAHGEACVCHLETVLGYRQAYISQQLMRLREAGLVIDRREGMNVFYTLAGEAVVRMLDVAQETVSTLAEAKGRKVEFFVPAEGSAVGCTCPHCRPQLDGLIAPPYASIAPRACVGIEKTNKAEG
jgi:DNA-binding transcriptional ArsR family regulator